MEQETNALHKFIRIFLMSVILRYSCDGNFLYSESPRPKPEKRIRHESWGIFCNFRVFWGLPPPQKKKKHAGHTKTETLGILFVASIYKWLNLVNAKFQKHRFWNTPFLCLASSCLNWGQVGFLLVKGHTSSERNSLDVDLVSENSGLLDLTTGIYYKHHLCLFKILHALSCWPHPLAFMP